MAPGDTLRIGSCSTGEVYEEASEHVTTPAKRWSRIAKRQLPHCIMGETVSQQGPERRQYYYIRIGRTHVSSKAKSAKPF